MGDRLLVAYFADEADLLEAVRESRQRQFTILDVFAPYAVHGLDEALGRRPSRLTWACFIFGAIGLTTALVLQIWTSEIDWAVNVGGKPFNSLPAFIPVAFELTVLFAALGTVFSLLVRTRLFPGKQPKKLFPRVTNDRFALVLVESDAAFDVAEATQVLRGLRATDVQEQVED